MVVYKITNKVNNKFYIGITTGDIATRLRGHRQSTNPYLTQAMKKYGKENFIIEQIATAKTNKELDRKEIALIKKLKPHYNFQTGGREFNHHNQETKDRLSKIMSKKLIGNQNRLGKTFTKEQRERISKGMKGIKNKLGHFGPNKNPYKGEYTWLKGDNNPAKKPEVRAKLRAAALRRYKKTL